jgi:probable addiction module antidote protein
MPTRDYKTSLYEDLQDPEFVVAYLNAALEEGSQDVFLLHLRDVAEAWGGMGKLAGETHLAREALYRMLGENGNPQFIKRGFWKLLLDDYFSKEGLRGKRIMIKAEYREIPTRCASHA